MPAANTNMLSFATFCANEAHALPGLLQSIKPHFNDIVIICTASKDGTWEYLREQEHKWFPVLRPYKLFIPLSPHYFDFGYVRTTAAHLCRGEYVFMLDCDERMEDADLVKLKAVHEKAMAYDASVVAFRRRHWYDSPVQRQKENVACSPDWQSRLIKNDGSIWFRRPVHETALSGPEGMWQNHVGVRDVVIHHHHDWFKSKAQVKMDAGARYKLYQALAAADPEWAASFKLDMLPADEPRRRMVRRLYKQLLGRLPTVEETRVWAGSGRTEKQIREEILKSEEYKQNVDDSGTAGV